MSDVDLGAGGGGSAGLQPSNGDGGGGAPAPHSGEPEPNDLSFSMVGYAHRSGGLDGVLSDSSDGCADIDGQLVPKRLLKQLEEQLTRQMDELPVAPLQQVLPKIVAYLCKGRSWSAWTGQNCSSASCQTPALGGITGGRPHHCRVCGDCFCYRCAPKTSELVTGGPQQARAAAVDAHPLPAFVQLLSHPAAADTGWLYAWSGGGAAAAEAGGEYRRCESCTRMLETVNAPGNQEPVQLMLSAIRKMQHRRVQLKLPHHTLTADEEKFLRQMFLNEPELFVGHR